jgi:hypothetical protein
MNPSVNIPVRVINATSQSGYFDLFHEFLSETQSRKEAYEKTEAELARYGLPGRYSCYENLVRALRRRLKLSSVLYIKAE